MSKTALKKELALLDRDQLVEVVLNAYSAHKEIKNYFEFFLDPDPKKLAEEQLDLIGKEINRSKYGRCKARISFIRGAIKQAEAYGIDNENLFHIVHNTLRMLVGTERYYHFSESLSKGAVELAAKFVEVAASMGEIERALTLIDGWNREGLGRDYFRRRLMARANEAVKELTQKSLSKSAKK